MPIKSKPKGGSTMSGKSRPAGKVQPRKAARIKPPMRAKPRGGVVAKPKPVAKRTIKKRPTSTRKVRGR